MAEGFILLYRQMMESEMWKSEPFTRGQAWVDLLMLANHQDGWFRCRGVRVEVKRGQVGYGAVALGKRWQWSRGKVNRFLKELEMDQQIEQQKNNVTTLISIKKYDEYQAKQDSKKNNKRTANGQQTDSKRTQTNNDNNENNEKENNTVQKIHPDWMPNENNMQMLIESGMTEFERKLVIRDFVDYWKGEGTRRKDWQASFRKNPLVKQAVKDAAKDKNNLNQRKELQA